jgi:hypothetical protein
VFITTIGASQSYFSLLFQFSLSTHAQYSNAEFYGCTFLSTIVRCFVYIISKNQEPML